MSQSFHKKRVAYVAGRGSGRGPTAGADAEAEAARERCEPGAGVQAAAAVLAGGRALVAGHRHRAAPARAPRHAAL